MLADMQSAHVKWISKLLHEALAVAQNTELVIDPRVYITGPNVPSPEDIEGSDSGSISADSPTSEKLPVYSLLRIIHGRPSVRKIFEEEIPASPGPVSVDGKSDNDMQSISYSSIPQQWPVRRDCRNRYPAPWLLI